VTSPKPFKAACVQLTTGQDIQSNINSALNLVERACDLGADFVMLPEVCNLMEPDAKTLLKTIYDECDDPAIKQFSRFAKQHKVYLLAGSVVVKSSGKAANRSILINAQGEIQARYDKMHLFDVDLGVEAYHESATYDAGSEMVVADTGWGRLGMSVCYDLRFPGLYRKMAQNGALYLSVPSAFTQSTGAAHWHVLLRARAIETGCYVFAPAQTGVHQSGRKTYGRSLIIDPWGQVLADGGVEKGVVIADIDPCKVDDARRKIPSLFLERDY